jgi:hypothetical protein
MTMSDSISGPANTADRGGPRLVSFFVKTVAIGAVATISLTILIHSVFSEVDELIDRRVAQLHGKFGGRNFWAHIEQSIHRAAEAKDEVSLEKQRRLLADIHILAGRARPFALEAAAALAPEPPNPADAKAK